MKRPITEEAIVEAIRLCDAALTRALTQKGISLHFISCHWNSFSFNYFFSLELKRDGLAVAHAFFEKVGFWKVFGDSLTQLEN